MQSPAGRPGAVEGKKKRKTRRQDKSTNQSKKRMASATTDCAICLEALAVPGTALFVAECGHSFHFRCDKKTILPPFFAFISEAPRFRCIESNARSCNRTCPLCRVSWQTLPFTCQQQLIAVTAPVPAQVVGEKSVFLKVFYCIERRLRRFFNQKASPMTSRSRLSQSRQEPWRLTTLAK